MTNESKDIMKETGQVISVVCIILFLISGIVGSVHFDVAKNEKRLYNKFLWQEFLIQNQDAALYVSGKSVNVMEQIKADNNMPTVITISIGGNQGVAVLQPGGNWKKVMSGIDARVSWGGILNIRQLKPKISLITFAPKPKGSIFSLAVSARS